MEIDKVTFNVQKVKAVVRKKISKEKGLTQKEFAESLGTSVTSLFSQNPTARKIAEIATLAEVDPNSFFNIPTPFLTGPDTSALKEEIIEYERKENILYKELCEKQDEIIRLMKLNEKYRLLLQKNNILTDEIYTEDND